MTDPRPRISVITIVFNGEKHLEQAIASVRGQTYDNIEYIVVDGGSTDGTLGIVRKHEDRIDRWVSEPDNGIYDAMNKGIALASGEIIGMLNSDDWYAPGALESVAEEYRRSPDKDVAILGRWNAVFEDIDLVIACAPSTDFHRLRMCHQALFVPRRVYEAVGPYDTSYRYSADLDMALRIRARGIPFLVLDATVVNYRTSGASGTNYRATGREQSAIIRRHLPFRSYLLFRILRIKFEGLSALSQAIEKTLGKKASARLRRLYYGITAGRRSS